jgi:SAM-dependent methyltransferase
VDDVTNQYLLNLNRQFYQTFALQFSATRQRLQPGVLRVIQTIPSEGQVLDLGCGNGELARELARQGFQGYYQGIDQSAEFLAEAKHKLAGNQNFFFIFADLTSVNWHSSLPAMSFDVIMAFAVLHHIPGSALRRQLLTAVRSLLSPAGRFIHSEWQFLSSPRLQARLQPWEKVGLTANQVDPGDYLIDWRAGSQGLRYVHFFTEEELAALAKENGFKVYETFLSDGEGGKLGLYQIWKRV